MAKLVILFVCALVAYSYAGLTPEQAARSAGYQKTCFGKTGVDEKTLATAAAAGPPFADNIKKHLICLGQECKLIESDGTYKVDTLTTSLATWGNSPDKVKAIVSKCTADQGTPDASVNMVSCVFNSFMD